MIQLNRRGTTLLQREIGDFWDLFVCLTTYLGRKCCVTYDVSYDDFDRIVCGMQRNNRAQVASSLERVR